MEPKRLVKYGIGCIIADCILIFEAIVDIRTGRRTLSELLIVIILCLLFAILLVALIKKNMRKKRDQFKSTKTEEQDSGLAGSDTQEKRDRVD